MASSKNAIFDKFLKEHNAVKGEGFTHTRIGDQNLSIYGGSYNINDNEWSTFMQLYYQHVFVNGNKEYLTEKQLIENGPIMIDIDMRYDSAITERQYSKDHIIDAVMLYAEKIVQLLDVSDGTKIPVYVMEKKNVNKLDNKTKDGIHMIIGIQMHKALQVMLRDRVLPEIKNIWDDLPITNEWDDVLDEGVTKGFVNWQLYGSCKPANQTYNITYHFELEYHNKNWDIIECPLAKFSVEKNILKLSARYTEHPSFPLKQGIVDDFETAKQRLNKTNKKPAASVVDGVGADGKSKHKLKMKHSINAPKSSTFTDISSETMLDNMIEGYFEDVGPMNYRLKETHQYTMCLPSTYYGPGSYNKWIRVGMALYNTSPDLFLTWVKMSCQENCRDTLKSNNGKFDWRLVPELYELWNGFSLNPDGLTYRSILYWAKNDAKEKYEAIRTETIDFFLSQTIQNPTEFDLASVLYNMYKDKFVCISIKNKIWYEYINHRWVEIDSGNTLRMSISKEMHAIYFDKTCEITNQAHLVGEPGTPDRDKLMKIAQKLNEICAMLKKTQSKQNIMREACELFYDKDFIEKLDMNPYLLCFNNGVVDFKQRIHRKGQPDDFISKCTNIDYVPFNPTKQQVIVNEIKLFMEQLFPVKDLENYMWEHLASCLIGINTNQTFHIYKGSGRNGKSVLTSLMSKCLGAYKGTVPITLITAKRNSIGSTSSEVAMLIGVRYAVMQEPSKGDKINEGIMKELTGGTDPIQARALFKDTITFIPQFKLVVCTNTDFENTSDDDGTWRRMRYIDFMSKFLEKPYEDEIKFPRSECPYQFELDKKIEEKFEQWAPVFMGMLVSRTYNNLGLVNDCPIVMSTSDKHRESQDYLAGFVKENVRQKEGSVIKKTNMMESFKVWYIQNYGKGSLPKGKEITEYMNKRFGVYKNGWHNVEVINDADDDDPLDEL
jgi:P4 family phage/plasmid primase-like protien